MPAEPKYQWPEPHLREGMTYLGPATVLGEEVSLYAYATSPQQDACPWLYILHTPATGRAIPNVHVAPNVEREVRFRLGGHGLPDGRSLDDFVQAAGVALARARVRGYRV